MNYYHELQQQIREGQLRPCGEFQDRYMMEMAEEILYEHDYEVYADAELLELLEDPFTVYLTR